MAKIIKKRSVGKKNVVEISLSAPHTYIHKDGYISHNCPHCRRLYLKPDGTPKVFSMKQLLSNGTNYGRKTADWKPVVGATHPNCRCHNNMLPDGFGFDKNGDMEFKNADYKHKAEK